MSGGPEKFTKKVLDNKTLGQWYLRQMPGNANIDAGPAMGFLIGNLVLSDQIETTWPGTATQPARPDLMRVEALPDKYDLPTPSGSLPVQYLESWRTVDTLALPNKYLTGNRRRRARDGR